MPTREGGPGAQGCPSPPASRRSLSGRVEPVPRRGNGRWLQRPRADVAQRMERLRAGDARLPSVRSFQGLEHPGGSHMKTISWLAAGALALAVGCASSNTSGPPGTATAPHPAVGAPVATASGTIQNYTTGPGGQQDGFTLATGQRVHFAESMGSKVSDQFPPNTVVKVEGYMTKDAEGRPVLEANTISAPDRNAKLDLTAGAAAP